MLAAIAAALLLVIGTSIMLKLLWGSGAGPSAPPALQRQVAASAAPAAVSYVPWEAAKAPGAGAHVLVVDCTHSSARTITHHKASRNPPLSAGVPGGPPGSDCSTGLVLDALLLEAAEPGAAAPWLAKTQVSVNHFDADAVLSVWALIHREKALAHSAVLRHAARIGDMREAGLGDGQQAAAIRAFDGVESEEQVLHALKLCCWMNTIEKRDFSPPYAEKDADAKHAYFLERLGAALTPEGIEALRQDWEPEFEQVLSGWRQLEAGRPAGARLLPHLGLAVLRPPAPLHYYSLFSHAAGADVVATLMPDSKYEVECRYTQFVCLRSRPVQARLDMGPLAAALNRVDTGREAGTHWAASSMVDTGPVLRLDRGGEKLSKFERYGHPTDRPHFASGLPPAAFEAAVVSFFEHGLAGAEPRVGGWEWEELQELNQGLDWAEWEAERLPAALAAAGVAER